VSTQIVIDPAGEALPAEVGRKSERDTYYIFITYDLNTAKRNGNKAEHDLIAALSYHHMGWIGILDCSFTSLATDFLTEDSLIRHLQAAGVVAPMAPFEV
jgi:hypothetical protein